MEKDLNPKTLLKIVLERKKKYLFLPNKFFLQFLANFSKIYPYSPLPNSPIVCTHNKHKNEMHHITLSNFPNIFICISQKYTNKYMYQIEVNVAFYFYSVMYT